MSFQTWLAFFLSASVTAVSPGSGAVLSMSHGLSYGVRSTLVTIAGMELALMLVLFVSGAGVGTILVASGTLFLVIKGTGILYLAWLGIAQWRAPVTVAAIGNDAAVSTMSRWRRAATGFFTNASNPKSIVFMVAALPQFIQQEAPLWPQLLILALTIALIDAMAMLVYAYGASRLQLLLSTERAILWKNRLFGFLLLLMAGGLVFLSA